MAFNLSDVGIERGATQVLFDHPPIIEERHAESAQDTSYEIAIDGSVVGVQFVKSQTKATVVAGLETLRETRGAVTVKLKPGDATTITCLFGPDSMQEFTPYTGAYPESDKSGAALPNLMKTYRVKLTLLRLE